MGNVIFYLNKQQFYVPHQLNETQSDFCTIATICICVTVYLLDLSCRILVGGVLFETLSMSVLL